MQAEMFCIAVYMVCCVPNSIVKRNSHIPHRQACSALWMCHNKLVNHTLEQQQISGELAHFIEESNCGFDLVLPARSFFGSSVIACKFVGLGLMVASFPDPIQPSVQYNSITLSSFP